MTKKSLGTALITGGAKRIGAQIAIFLAKAGYDVIIHYNKSAQEAKALQYKINTDIKVNCHLIKADLTDNNQIYQLVKEIKNNFKNWNLLINNASIFHKSTFLNSTIAEISENFDIHLKAPLILTQNFSSHCVKKNIKGNVINIIDSNIARYNTKYFSYLLSKKSLAEFTKMVAVELAPRIRVNAIAPSFIVDNIHELTADYEMENLINKIPLQKKGSENNITKTIEYLLNNNYITGQILFVDGGASLKVY